MNETELLSYLIKTGPIPVTDLALRSDDVPQMLETLDKLKRRGDVEIQAPPGRDTLGDLKREITQLQLQVPQLTPAEIRQRHIGIVRQDDAAPSTIVQLSPRAFRRFAY